MFRKLLLVFALALVGMVGGQPHAAVAQDAPRDVTFFLTYIPNIQFSPLYVAIEKGYFADAGLNVKIQHGDEPDGVNLIAADELKFGIISGEQIIAARMQGRPVVFVYEWFQQYPVGILVTDASGVTEAAALQGMKIGIPGLFGASYTGAIALLIANDMTERDVQLEVIGYNSPQVVCVGGVQAAVVYMNNEPLQIADRIAHADCGSVTGTTVFPVSDAADMVSNGVTTNEATIADDPELVRAVVAAFDAGLSATINNPAEAYLLSAAHVEGLPLPDDLRAALEAEAAEQTAFLADHPDATRDAIAAYRADLGERLAAQFDSTDLLQFNVLLTSIAIWDADQLGYTDPASWAITESTLVEMGLVEATPDLDRAYSNDFLPEQP